MKSAFWYLLFLALVAGSLVGSASAQALNATQLRAAREAAVSDWLIKTNFNLADDLNKTNFYLAPDAIQIVENAGTFEGPVIGEYQVLGWLVPPVLKFYAHNILYGSGRWIDTDTFYFKYNNSFAGDFYGSRQGLDYFVDNLEHYEVIRFVPGQVKIVEDFIGLDPYILAVQNEQGLIRTNTPEGIAGVCALIVTGIPEAFLPAACPANSPFAQFATIQECLGFYLSLPQNSIQTFCPYGFGNTNSVQCRLVHLNLAYVDPAIHCPHLGPNSMPCRDTCVDSCQSCGLFGANSPVGYPTADPATNAYCAPINRPENRPIQTFQCACNDGTVSRPDLAPSPNRTYCKPITCTKEEDCRSNPGTVSCVSGKCVPRRTFTWNSTLAAYNARDMSQCKYGNNRVFWDTTGTPHCVPPGFCLPAPANSPEATKWQCMPEVGGLQPYNRVSCANISTNDYGIPQYVKDKLGPRNFGCICNRGFLGGTSQPCVCPAGYTIQWWNGKELCLKTNVECTANYQCPHGKTCVFSTDPIVGLCQ